MVADPKQQQPQQLHLALQRCELQLEGGHLWKRFHALGTEMVNIPMKIRLIAYQKNNPLLIDQNSPKIFFFWIVTRSGRRMFPTLQLRVVRLERDVR